VTSRRFLPAAAGVAVSLPLLAATLRACRRLTTVDVGSEPDAETTTTEDQAKQLIQPQTPPLERRLTTLKLDLSSDGADVSEMLSLLHPILPSTLQTLELGSVSSATLPLQQLVEQRHKFTTLSRLSLQLQVSSMFHPVETWCDALNRLGSTVAS
jgi:hypothetical protein